MTPAGPRGQLPEKGRRDRHPRRAPRGNRGHPRGAHNTLKAQPVIVIVARLAFLAVHQGDVGILAVTLHGRIDEGRVLDVQAIELTL